MDLPMHALTGMSESRGVWHSTLLGYFGTAKLLLECVSLSSPQQLHIGISHILMEPSYQVQCVNLFVGQCHII